MSSARLRFSHVELEANLKEVTLSSLQCGHKLAGVKVEEDMLLVAEAMLLVVEAMLLVAEAMLFVMRIFVDVSKYQYFQFYLSSIS